MYATMVCELGWSSMMGAYVSLGDAIVVDLPFLTDFTFPFVLGLITGLTIGVLLYLAGQGFRADESTSLGESEESAPGTAATDSAFWSREVDDMEHPVMTADEEHVVQLLVENGGRMKQSDIVGETEWSKAKVSRLLSTMEARGQITKITIGRENVIVLGNRDDVEIP